ncbi:DUF4232 domain-containing protein [Streptomyces sp. T-3]|nr:DUF4232 domain-containing protein [Streptomyces sp. T-3]
MRTARRHTRTWKSCALGATVVAALLTSTACEPGGDDDNAGGEPSAKPSVTASEKPGTTGGSEDSGGSGNSGGSNGGSGDSGGSGGSGEDKPVTVACTDAEISISPTFEDGEGEPDEHMLLIATNTGDKPCNLYHYPYVTFVEDAPGDLKPIESSKPQAVTTLGPDEKAYAGLRLSSPTDQAPVERISVLFQEREPGSHTDGGPVEVPLPEGHEDLMFSDGAQVTYWTGDVGAAKDAIFK